MSMTLFSCVKEDKTVFLKCISHYGISEGVAILHDERKIGKVEKIFIKDDGFIIQVSLTEVPFQAEKVVFNLSDINLLGDKAITIELNQDKGYFFTEFKDTFSLYVPKETVSLDSAFLKLKEKAKEIIKEHSK